MLISSADAFANAMNAPNSRWAKTIERFANDRFTIAHAPKFRLEPAHRFFCIGSCFARNIEEALICRGVEVLSKRMVSPREEHPARVTGVINKFTTASMLNEARWALSGEGSGDCSIVDGGEGWLDLQINPNARPVTRERAEERRRYLERDYFARMRQADVLVVTLGLIETWRDEENEVWQNMAPPFYLARRQPGRF
ncbi:MAG: GSCFA domain-containing protein, partial [Proteobacteria bacterium]|nr:GSCFA domain-containing protein [Pseudomonadota bacterium]